MRRIIQVFAFSLAFWLSASAFAQVVTINQSFNGTTAPGWTLGGSGYTPILTANGGGDANGSGWLRLTNSGGNESTFAKYDTAFNGAHATIAVKFSFATYNGSGADGITFFLADASKTFGAGAYGGSLGYAQKTAAGGATDINGMNGGYIGVGIDEFGNYSNPTEGRVGGVGSVQNAIAVRGPGQGLTGYDYLGGTGNLGTNSIAFPGSATRPTGANTRSVEMILTATNQLTIYMSGGGGSYVPLYTIDLSGYARPDQLIMGFTGSTGGATDIHEIQNVSLSSVAANLWTNAAGSSTWGATGANWSGAVAPVAGADILLDNTYVSTAQAIDVGAGQTRSVRSIQIDAPFAYTLNNGTLELNNNGVLGPSGIFVSQTNGSATQTINSNLLADNAIEIRNASSSALNLAGSLATNGNAVTVDGDGATTMAGVISGTGSLIKNDSGTVTLSGANTYTGGTTVNSGTLRLGASNVLADTGAVNIGAAGTVNLNGFSERIGALTAAGGATIDFGAAAGANTLLFGVYTPPASGVLVVNNWETGVDTLATTTAGQNVSTVYLAGYGIASEAGTASNTIYGSNSGYLLTPAAQTWAEWDGSNSVNWNNANNWTPANVPDTSGELASFGILGNSQRAVTLNANETITGLRFTADAGVTGGYSITGANTLTMAGPLAFIQQKSSFNETLSPATLQLTANTVVDTIGSGSLTIGSVITGAGNLVKENTGGKLILSGNSTAYAGNIYVDSGVLQITNGGALGATSGTTTVADRAALEISGATVSSAENITLQGTGVGNGGAIRSLAGTNTLSGTLTLAADSRINADAGLLTLSTNVTGTTNADLTLGGAGNINVTGTISTGGGGVTKDGAGTVTFSGANSYTGATNVSAGTLALGANNTLANSTAVTVASGATLNLNNFSDAVGSIAGAGSVTLGSGTLTAGNDGTSTAFAGVISGTGGLTKTGAGTLTLSGNDTYTGGTTISAGTLALGASERLANTGAVAVAGGAALTLNNYNETIGALSGAGTVTLGSGTLTVGSGNASSTFAGSFASGDTGTLAKTGTGALTFGAGVNLSNGNLVLNGGTLNLGGFTSKFGALSITAASILDFGTTGNSVLDILGAISFTGTGFNLTIQNWTNTVDYFYAQFGDPGSPIRSRIVFNGYTAADTKWQSFDHEITPVPEPSLYGAVLAVIGLAVGWMARRRRTA